MEFTLKAKRLRQSRFREPATLWVVLASSALCIGLGLACALPERTDAIAPAGSLESFLEKAAKREVARIDVYYEPWDNWMQSVREARLTKDVWTYRTTIMFPDVSRLADSLRSMNVGPVEKPPKDFRLACVFHYDSEDTEPLVLSFAKHPLSICINGVAFCPTWDVYVSVADYLPCETRQMLLDSIAREWESSEKQCDVESERNANGDRHL